MLLSHQKAIDNKLLNLVGFQPFRYVLSKLVTGLKRYLYTDQSPDFQALKKLRADGLAFLQMPDAVDVQLLDEQINYLRSILNKDTDDEWIEGIQRTCLSDFDTCVTRLILPISYLKNNPRLTEIYRLIVFSPAWKLMSSDLGSKTSLDQNQIVWFDKIVFGKDSSVANWHTDTFYDSYKYWYFPYGIPSSGGIPMNYLAGTNNFSLHRLMLEYWKSITFDKDTDLSWRIKPNSSFVRRRPVLNTVSAPRSSLLVNVHGFHARATVESGSSRYQLHFSIRQLQLVRKNGEVLGAEDRRIGTMSLSRYDNASKRDRFNLKKEPENIASTQN